MLTSFASGISLGDISAVVAIGAAAFGFWKWRRDELRHADVHAWALLAIRVQKSSEFLVATGDPKSKETLKECTHLMAECSVLIEQGRLYFRNIPGKGAHRKFGADKPLAYRGYRPLVLDQLKLTFEALDAFKNSQLDYHLITSALGDARGNFVSMMQKEVGRSRTRARALSEAGAGSPLANFLVTFTGASNKLK